MEMDVIYNEVKANQVIHVQSKFFNMIMNQKEQAMCNSRKENVNAVEKSMRKTAEARDK